jgi:hypothetical protein
MAQKKMYDNKFFFHPSFIAVFGSGIRDKHPGSATLILTINVPLILKVRDVMVF